MSAGNGTVPISGNVARMLVNAYLVEAGYKPIPAERWKEYPAALAHAIRNRKRDDDDQS